MDHRWSGLWAQLDECRQTKLFFPAVDKNRAHKIMILPRNKWSRIIQFASGHCFLNRHDFLCYGIEDESYDPMCQLCDHNYQQTAAHIISECPYFLGLRSDIFQEFILNPPFLHPIGKILKFLLQSGLEGLHWEEEMVQNNTT